MLEFLLSSDAIFALITLTFLEVVLGIDNIVFISIVANKLPENQRSKATNIGLVLAMVQRIVLLFFISFLISLKTTIIDVNLSWFTTHVSWQSLILFSGGLFLLYKSTSEIYAKTEQPGKGEIQISKKNLSTLGNAIFQIVIIDFIFSVDSILTAIGMTNGISPNPNHALMIMVIAVVISMIIMIIFANPIRKFIDSHPSMQLLGLAFLILIGFMLIAEAAHISETVIFKNSIGVIPKGYLYFAISFSLFVEFLNFKMNKKSKTTN
ncbi:MAG: TerC family protein [Bacteroidia bacterium]|nr:TerC family protein [Bacteroidia bacterium]NND25606.1 TerC family protein [Flavobacteriaceae bacterium]MBT8279493.1 TerC family protein [Bacteroidia bacterium]NNK60220.1 TerC family protein [Flavobacteriaceae bacterium]NNL32729.1 TerC family protein [Flavobacteriaceae bacterium]